MILHVQKHPSSQLLATCIELPDATPAPEGWEAMSVDDFKAWEAAEIAGGWVAPAPEPEPASIPESVTRRQLLLWLNSQGVTRAGIRDILANIADPTAREAALIEFDEAMDFRRDHPLVAQLATLLGYDSAGIDAGFVAAAAL